MKGKFFAIILTCISILSLKTLAYAYENVITQFNQVNTYIDNGLYLEAISLCNDVIENHNISDNDVFLFTTIKNEALIKYKNYIESNKTISYSIPSWGMTCLLTADCSPYRESENLYTLYESNDGDGSIQILKGSSDEYYLNRPSSTLKNFTHMIEFNFLNDNWSVYKHGGEVEVLSENNISINGIPAVQKTARLFEYLNEESGESEFYIYRCIVLTCENSSYIIYANENMYLWSDEFWKKLDTICNSISFY